MRKVEMSKFDSESVLSEYVCGCGFRQQMWVPLGKFVRVEHACPLKRKAA